MYNNIGISRLLNFCLEKKCKVKIIFYIVAHFVTKRAEK